MVDRNDADLAGALAMGVFAAAAIAEVTCALVRAGVLDTHLARGLADKATDTAEILTGLHATGMKEVARRLNSASPQKGF